MKNTVLSNNADTSRQSSRTDASAVFPPEKEYQLLKAVNEALLHLLSEADKETALQNAWEMLSHVRALLFSNLAPLRKKKRRCIAYFVWQKRKTSGADGRISPWNYRSKTNAPAPIIIK